MAEMDDTNEIEALCDVAFRALDEGPIVESPPAWMPRVARAVRDAVLASLQARGGMFGADDMRQALNAVDVLAPLHGHALRKQFAAHGATIAALQQRAEQAEAALTTAQARIDELASMERVARERADAWESDADRQQARAERAETRAEQAERERDEARVEARNLRGRLTGARSMRRAAESALATLRKAFANTERRTDRFDGGPCWCEPYARSSEESPHDAHCTRNRGLLTAATPAPEHPDTVNSPKTLESSSQGNASMASNGSEHPDTATLRGIYERTRDLHKRWFHQLPERVRNYVSTSCWNAARWAVFGDRVLRSVGYSCDEDTGEHVWRRDEQGVCLCGSKTRLLGDLGPSGVGETCTEGQHIWTGDEDGPCICGTQTRTRIMDALLEVTPTTPGLAACVPVEAEPETLRVQVDRCKAQRNSEPTEAEDCETVERVMLKLADPFPPATSGEVDDAKEALARLKQARQLSGDEALRRLASRLGDEATAHNVELSGEALEVALFHFVHEEDGRSRQRAAEEMRERCVQAVREASLPLPIEVWQGTKKELSAATAHALSDMLEKLKPE